jgi:hypothetical protein
MYKFFSLQRLLWIDGIAALTSGCMVLLFTTPLAGFFNLPQQLLRTLAFISLGYAAYSLYLAQRKIKPRPLLKLLVFANCAWVVVCLSVMLFYSNTATCFGSAYFILEALFVVTLAFLEWRQIRLLMPVLSKKKPS